MLEGAISEAEYVAALRLHRRRALLIWYGVALACAIAGVAVGLATRSWVFAGALVGGGGGGALAQFATEFFYIGPKAKKLYSQSKDFASPLRYTWDGSALEVSGANGTWKRNWADFVKFRENEHLILLYVNDALFNVVPKRWFSSEADLQEFSSHAQNART